MAQPVIQTAFHAGEWAPALNARVDLAKYHSAAALLRNWYVDYRGGASTRMGTKYVIHAFKTTTVRLWGFQASFDVGYIIEFGNFYMRFHFQGAPVLENGISITALSQGNPAALNTAVPHGFSTGDSIYITNVNGMTQINNRFYRVVVVTASQIQLQDLNGNNINSTVYSAYTSGGSVARVYTVATPYQADDVFELKFSQNVNKLVITHPDYVPYELTLVSANNWILNSIQFGASVQAPTGIAVATTLAAGTVNYSYTVTAVDANGQESIAGTAAALANRQDLRTTAGTNRVTWNSVTGAVAYNVYKSEISYTNAVAAGAAHGYIGTVTGTTFDDSNIAPDFIETPPLAKNPFQGAGVASAVITGSGVYTSVPTVTISAAPSGGVTATASAVLHGIAAAVVAGGAGYSVGDAVAFPNGIVLIVATVSAGAVTGYQPLTFTGTSRGSVTSGNTPTNPLSAMASGGGGGGGGSGATINMSWGVGSLTISNPGAGYTSTPSITFSAGAATATAVLQASTAGNPSVSAFDWQRLILAGPTGSPHQFNMSQPGLFYNFNVTDPAQPDDAISGLLVSKQLNDIKALIPMQSGLIAFTSKSAWQIYGQSAGQAPTAIDITAQEQAYNGTNDVPPLVINDSIVYVQAKGSSVRHLNYNFYTNVYTGTDIAVLSSHLFFGKQIVDWCWAEEPFKTAWVIRNDGIALSLAFVREQELIGWGQHQTNGLFKSTASVIEPANNSATYIDVPYFVVQRTINGQTVQFIERMADRFYENYIQPWCVDAGLRYNGTPVTTLFGFEHLANTDVVGLADGVPFEATISASGTLTFADAKIFVTAGLAYTPDLQTLAIDTGNPTIQSKDKKIPAVTLRVQETLGLEIGSDFDHLVPMKDLVQGNVGSMSNEVVTDLVTGDARTILDSRYTVPGQYCIRQTKPWPATILGVIPEIEVGDTKK